MTFKERLAEVHKDNDRKVIQKALKKTTPTASHAFVKVTGTEELRRFAGEGWELVYSLSLGHAVGAARYIMRKPQSAAREQVES